MPSFDLVRKLAAEFIGTLLLLATVVGSGIMASNLADGNNAIALLGNTLATGCILFVLITTLGPVSGAHFNPAVTVSMRVQNEITLLVASAYMVVQVTGGIVGCWLAHFMFEQSILQIGTNARTGIAQWMSEGVATFGLVAVILLGLRFRPNAVAALVGVYISAAYWFTASTSFANPAVTIARAFTDTFSGIAPVHMPAFVLAQFIGALVATFLFKLLLKRDDNSTGTSD